MPPTSSLVVFACAGILAVGLSIEPGLASVGHSQQATPASATAKTGVPSNHSRRLPFEMPYTVMGAASVSTDGLTVGSNGSGDLAIVDLATGKELELNVKKGGWQASMEHAEDAVISGDGHLVAFTWWDDDDQLGLHVVGADGSENRQLKTAQAADEWIPLAWMPDNSALVAFTGSRAGGDLVRVTVADGSTRKLRTIVDARPRRAAVSPDGRYLAYDVRPADGGRGVVRVLALATLGDRPLSTTSGDQGAPFWAPDGSGVFFIDSQQGRSSLRFQAMAAGEPRGGAEVIEAEFGGRIPLGTTKDGRFFFVMQTDYIKVYEAQLSRETGRVVGEPRALSSRYPGVLEATWSPDGRSLAYRVETGDGIVLWPELFAIRNVGTGEEREIRVPFHPASVEWSSTGRSLLVLGIDPAAVGLFEVDVESGRVAEVVPKKRGTKGFGGDARLMADGSVLFARTDTGIVRHNRASGAETTVVATGKEERIRDFCISPDGAVLSYTVIKGEGDARINEVQLFDLASRQRTSLMTVKGPVSLWAETWTDDGKAILAVRREARKMPAAILRIPVAGGEPEPLGIVGQDIRTVRVHPDGTRLVYTTGVNGFELWVSDRLRPLAGDQASRGGRW